MPYTPEQRATICAALLQGIADGKSLREICRAPDHPPKWTILTWLNADADLAAQYARAKSEGLEALADEITDIADNASNDWMERSYGDQAAWVANGEAVRRSHLRIDSRKWILSKLVPKKYGDKLDVAHSGSLTVVASKVDEGL